MSYTKLFSDIVMSSIWDEDNTTRLLWITMLATKDQYGRVMAAVTGLAHAARITIEECEKGLTKLESPDPYSRSKDFEGRRIRKIDGGWIVLNHQKYKDKQRDRREYYRKYRENRKDFDNLGNGCATTFNHSQPITTDCATDISVSVFNNKYNISYSEEEYYIFKLWCTKIGCEMSTMRAKLAETVLGGIRDHIHKGVEYLSRFVGEYSGNGPYFAQALINWEKSNEVKALEARKTNEVKREREKARQLMYGGRKDKQIDSGAI